MSKTTSTSSSASAEHATCEVVIANKLGLHARPAAMFVRMASRFSCDVLVEKNGEEINGKSIMGLMLLAAGCGARLTITAKGKDAAQAVDEISRLIARKFDEE